MEHFFTDRRVLCIEEIKTLNKISMKFFLRLGALLVLLATNFSFGATLPNGFTEQRLASGLDPTGVTALADGRVLVTIKSGRILLFKNNIHQTTPFLIIPNVDNWNERGLLCVVEDPNFSINGYIYVYYTYKNPSNNVSNNRVSRFTVTGDVANASTQLVLINFDNLSSVGWHNGGGLVFGADGKLYASTGENANTSNAQSFSNLLGKVLRINSDGSIPSDNPFYNTTTGRNRAIYALGFRNPFRLKFQPSSGKIYINDVGAGRAEEINELKSGRNYGWPGIEGRRSNQTPPANYEDPIYAFGHSNGVCSITGGAAYSPTTQAFPAQYKDKYFFMDYCAGWIRYVDPANNFAVSNFATGIDRPLDMAVDAGGSLYYIARGGIGGGSDADNTSSSEGELWRVSYSGSSLVAISVQPRDRSVAVGAGVAFVVSATGAAPLRYQWMRNGQNIQGATQATYNIPATALTDNGAKFSVVVSNDVSSKTSVEAVLNVFANTPPVVQIITPDASILYRAGTTINFSGTATDAEDGELPASAYTWYVHFHHDTHYHPSLDPVSGITSGTFLIPEEGETSDTVWYRIYLTVTDALGTKTTVFKEIYPEKAQITLNTQPQGLSLKLDGNSITTPYTFTGVVGIKRILEADNTKILEGKTYGFESWSDTFNKVTQIIITPESNTTYTARYALSQTDTLGAIADAYVKGGTNAGTTFGTTDPLQLQTKTESDVERIRYSYLRFDISSLTSASGAKLRLFGKRNSLQNENIKVAVSGLSNNTWNENTLTWNNKPSQDTVSLDTEEVNASPTSSGQYYEWDVSSYVISAKNIGASTVSFFVSNPEVTEAYVMFNSKEATANRPQLIVNTLIVTSLTKDQEISPSIFPNPFIEHFSIQNMGVFKYSISNLRGTLMEEGLGSDQTILGNQLGRGMYIVKIDGTKGHHSFKIAKY